METPLWLEVVAVSAAVASSVVIGWQAVLTRRAVRSADLTVGVAERALRESQLSRLESQVPRVLVDAAPGLYVTEMEKWHPGRGGGTPSRWVAVSEDDRFHLPRDAEFMLAFDFEFVVRNDGPGSVNLDMMPRARAAGESTSYLLLPNETRTYRTRVSHSVATWVKLAETPANDDSGALSAKAHCMSVRIAYKGPRDADIDEIHEIRLFGTIVEEDSGARGTWVPVNTLLFSDPIDVVVLPAKRVYWKSRIAQTKYEHE
jgi:hypothetical protein